MEGPAFSSSSGPGPVRSQFAQSHWWVLVDHPQRQITFAHPDGFDQPAFRLRTSDPRRVAWSAAARFDPTLDDVADPLGVAYGTIFQIISAGRENAWRNAEALVSAATPGGRALVAASIESEANALALTIRNSQSYVPGVSATRTRDAYCSVHSGDAAPTAYPFGTPTPYCH